MRFKGNLSLFIAALIWGSAFVAQRIGASFVGPFLFNAFRFLLAAAILYPFMHKRRQMLFGKGYKQFVLVGFFLFCGSALQQSGLTYTTAGNAGFITGLYVVLVPIILALLLKHKIPFQIWIAVIFATAGLYFLSINEKFLLHPGDGLEFIGAIFWAMHVVVISRFVLNMSVLRLAVGQFLVCGVLNLLMALIFESFEMENILHAAPAIGYTCIFSTAFAFTLQVFGQKHAPPTDAAIILSLEAAFAALFGFLVLDEILSFRQFMGAAIMFMGMIVAQIRFGRNPKPKTSEGV